MLRLLTKFKTQSLNEVKPYESNGSIVSAGEFSDDGTQHQTWNQDGFKTEHEADTSGKDLIRSPFLTRMSNVHTKAVQFPSEPFKEDEKLKTEDKENGELLRELNLSPNRPLSAEKRKWSDVKRSRFPKQNFSGDSSSSDEEVKELFSKQHKSSISSTNSSEERLQKTSVVKIRPSESHPRKRHRNTCHERIYSRPSLDFEKMQQKVFWRRSSYGTSRPRIVKVRSFSGHPHNIGSPLTTFQPIQVVQTLKLTPVEEARSLAY